MATINNITNLRTYSIALEYVKSLKLNRNAYIVFSQLIDFNELNSELTIDKIITNGTFGVNIKGDKYSDLIEVMYESDQSDYTVKYLDQELSMIRYLKKVEDPNIVNDRDVFWVYIKKNIKWGDIPSQYRVFNKHKSQHLCVLNNHISEYINDADLLNISHDSKNNIVLASVYNDDLSKSFNNDNDNEILISEFFIKISGFSMY